MKRILPFLLALGFALSAARAQSLLPATSAATELEALQKSFAERVAAGSRQLTEQYARALAKLEDDLVAAAEYEEAKLAQARRKELEATLSAIPGASAAGVALDFTDAKTSGTVVIENGAASGWRTSTSSLEWLQVRITPGRYVMEMTYLMTEPELTSAGASLLRFVPDATFKLFEPSQLFSAQATSTTVNLKRTEGTPDASPATVRSAPFPITRATLALRLEPAQAYPSNHILIRGIRLISADEAAAATVPPASVNTLATDPKSDIEKLRQVFLSRIATAHAPLVAAYQTRLKTLAAQPDVIADKDISADIAAEQKRAALAGTGGGGKPRWGALAPAVLDGFEDISGAKYIADPANTADRFKVEHAGQQFFVRLAWVRALPGTNSPKEALNHAVKHFNVSESDALFVGTAAHGFARDYLDGRPLRLLLRVKKDNDRDRHALVFLDGAGLFQSLLIDHGFAAFTPPPGGMERRPMIEASLLRDLYDRERKAMNQKPAPGAWAFRIETARQP